MTGISVTIGFRDIKAEEFPILPPAALIGVGSVMRLTTSQHIRRPFEGASVGAASKLASGPDHDERAQMVKADQRFQAVLGQAIESGSERIQAIEASVQMK